jgi:hypothetical protein
VITVNGVALMGGVDVKRKPTTEAAREARQRRLDARREYREVRRDLRHERHEQIYGRHDHRRNGELD